MDDLLRISRPFPVLSRFTYVNSPLPKISFCMTFSSMAIQNAILLLLLLSRPVFGSFISINKRRDVFSLSESDRSTLSKSRRGDAWLERSHFGVTSKTRSKPNSVSDDSDTQESQSRAPKAWTIPQGTRFGRLDSLELLDFSFQNHNDSAASAVKIATEAVGLNFADIFTVLGLYSAANLVRGESLSSFVPGLEFSGRILEDPSGTFQNGDRVLGFTRFGSYSEIVEVPPEFLVPLPDSWNYSQGAAFLVQALTAWHGLVEIGRMPVLTTKTNHKPFVVIVHSASGGVGLWASELAARRGGIVLGIVGDESKAKVFEDRIVSKLSQDSRVMIRGKEKYFSERMAKELAILTGDGEASSLSELAKCGHGADLVMESLGGDYFRASFDALNDGGALVTFGSTTYSSPGRGGINLLRLIWRYLRRPMIDPGDLTARNLRLSGFNLIFLTEQKEQLRQELSDCIACLSDKTDASSERPLCLDLVTPPVIGDTFDFQTQAVDAMEALKSGKTVGKVVLVNENPLKGQ